MATRRRQQKNTRTTATKRPKRRMRRESTPPSILFIFGDGDKLRADGLRLEVPSLVALGATLLSDATAGMIDATTDTALRRSVAEHSARRKVHDVVVVVGHGNERGVRLAADAFYEWHDFAELLRPLSPRRLVLVTCDGGRWPAAQVLFQRLPALRRIFASPTKASGNLGGLMVTLAPWLLTTKTPTAGEILAAQLAGHFVGGGQIRHWMRTRDQHNVASALHDVGAQLLDRFLNR